MALPIIELREANTMLMIAAFSSGPSQKHLGQLLVEPVVIIIFGEPISGETGAIGDAGRLLDSGDVLPTFPGVHYLVAMLAAGVNPLDAPENG
jgi:hypothetical protein